MPLGLGSNFLQAVPLPLVDPKAMLPPAATQPAPKPSFGQRFNEWFTKPESSAMLIRAGMGMMDNGLPGALQAATSYSDQHQQQQMADQLALQKLVIDQQNAATAAAKARYDMGKPDLEVIDGVAIDKRTGKPQFESPYNRVIPGPNGSFFEQPRIGFGATPAPGGAPTAAPVAAPNAAPALDQVAQPKSQAEYDAIPPGGLWIDAQGNKRRKGGAAPGSPTFR